MARIAGSGPRWLAPVVACTGATLAFLWPIPARLGREIAGPAGDNQIFYWNVWWFREALWKQHVSPFHTPMLFHPQGADLAYHTTAFLATLPASFLALFLPLPVAFNLVYIACFLFAALAMYGLAMHVLRRVGLGGMGTGVLALFAAFAYAFAPFHVAHMGHLNILNVGVVPFAAWMFLRAWEVRTVRRALGFGAALGLCTLADGYHVLAALLLVPLLGWLLVRQARAVGAQPAKRTAVPEPSRPATFGVPALRLAVVALAAFLVVSLPVLIPMLQYGTRGLEDVQAGGANEYVADVVSWVTPSPFHPLWGSALDRTYAGLSGNQSENVVFPTFTVLLLAWLGLRRGGREARLWLGVAAVFALLSLGPFLHFAGRSGIPIGDDRFLRLPLPKVILDALPLASGARAAGRFASVAQLGLALAAMLGLAQIVGVQRGATAPRHGLLLGALALVLFECLAWPWPTTRIDVPAAYRAAAVDARTRGVSGVLLEIPPVHADDKPYQLHQTVHGMPLLGGRLARAPRHAYDRLHRDPFLDRTMSPDPWRAKDGLLSLDGLDSLGVTYVVLRPQYPQSGAIARVLERRFEPVSVTGQERLYRRRGAPPR